MTTITELEDSTGISAYTIRYYDKCGFFPDLKRKPNGSRVFSDQDILQLRIIDSLRRSGLSIEGLQYFVSIQNQYDRIDEVQRILDLQLARLELQKEELENASACLEQLKNDFSQKKACFKSKTD